MILAIDPGNEQSAIVLWDGSRIHFQEILPNKQALQTIQELAEKHDPEVVVEMVASYGMAVGKTVFETVYWIGRFCEALSPWKVNRVYRQPVKLWHCLSPKAKDSNVRQSLIDKYGKPGTKKAPGVTYGLKKDLWAAFAIATYVTEAGEKAKYV